MEGFFRTNEQKVGGHKDMHPSFPVWKKATEARLVRLWRNHDPDCPGEWMCASGE